MPTLSTGFSPSVEEARQQSADFLTARAPTACSQDLSQMYNKDFIEVDPELSKIITGDGTTAYFNLKVGGSLSFSTSNGRAFFRAQLEEVEGQMYIKITDGKNETIFKERVENDPEAINQKFQELLERTALHSSGLRNVADSKSIWKNYLIQLGCNEKVAEIWSERFSNCFVAAVGVDTGFNPIISPNDFNKLGGPLMQLNFVEDIKTAKPWLESLGVKEIPAKGLDLRFDDGSGIRLENSGDNRIIVSVSPAFCSDLASSLAFRSIAGGDINLPANQASTCFEVNGIRVILPENSKLNTAQIRAIVERVQDVAKRIEEDAGFKLVEEIIISSSHRSDAAYTNGRTLILKLNTAEALLAGPEESRGAELTVTHEVSHLLEYRLRGVCLFDEIHNPSRFQKFWDSSQNIFMDFITDNFLASGPLTQFIEKYHPEVRFVLAGHPRTNSREFFASLLNSLYSPEAESTLLSMKNSNLSIRQWALQNLVPLLQHKIELVKQFGSEATLEAASFMEDYKQMVDYFKNSTNPELDKPVKDVVEFYCQALEALKEDLRTSMPNSAFSAGLRNRIDEVLRLLRGETN